MNSTEIGKFRQKNMNSTEIGKFRHRLALERKKGAKTRHPFIEKRQL